MSIIDEIHQLQSNIKHLKDWMYESSENIKGMMANKSELPHETPKQIQMLYGMHTAICVDTIDPFKQGAVRCFSPLLHEIQGVQIENLPWAMPISSQGGIDDSGCSWVPPAGSKLCLIFESGNRQRPFYLGTTWDRSRKGGWGLNVEEYEKIHRGQRGGYMVGTRGAFEAGVFLEGGPPGETRDDEQVFPPWNTENYNGYDIDSIQDFENDPESQNKITYPNIYGWKTPQKHMIKMVDGNYKCNMRWQRLEIKSAQGNHLIFKDDRVHPAPQWVNPDCGCDSGGDFSKCNEGDEPIEKPNECPTDTFGDAKPVPPKVMMIGGGGELITSEGGDAKSQCANPYFKHKSECRPYTGPKNPQNNKVDKTTLPQSGIQLTSLSGHTFWMDDSVNIPKGTNEWEEGTRKFDYGCDEVYKGKTVWKSAHGHQIMMSDCEPDDLPKTRGPENFIRILSATGNRIELNDDTKGNTSRAGSRRGIELQSTSKHMIQMIDENNDQDAPERKEGGTPVSKASNAFVKIKTGYGLEIMMADEDDQQDTKSQYIQIKSPQNDACCGPHLIRMQESDDCGYIFVRAGGDYVCISEGDHVTVVGSGERTKNNGPDFNTQFAGLQSQLAAAQASGDADAVARASEQLAQLELDNKDFCKGGCLDPKNWILAVSKHSVQWSCNFYFNVAEIHAFLAEKIILLMAGKDCPPPPGSNSPECSPCVGPVAVLLGSRLVASDRVFASASLESETIPIFSLMSKKKGINCPPRED
jgi:hypothetical protein